MNIETQIHLNKFKPRSYQLPIIQAAERDGYKRILAILPRRAGKDLTAFNLCIRAAVRKPQVIYYIFPTYAQGKKVIFDSITSDGTRILDYIPKELIDSTNSQEMKIRFKNGSLLQVVGSDNFDCFDDQTEILTENGWKLFKDLDKQDSVATLFAGKYLEYSYPIKYVEYDYDGELYGVSNSSIDFRVTPNHRFFVISQKGFVKFKTIDDPTIRHDKIPSQSEWISGVSPSTYQGYKTDSFMAFLGIFLSEGSTFSNEKCYRITISQTKPQVREKIISLLHDLSLNFVETKTGFNIENKELYNYFSQFGLQHERFIPKELKFINVRHLKVLFDWLVLGDGHSCKDYTAYYSTSKRLIDDVQDIIIKLGLSGNVHIKPQKQSSIKGIIINSKRTLYEIRVRKSKYKRLQGSNGKQYIKKYPYKGKVYCVSVKSGIIKVRRNGKEYWSGNSLMGTNPQICVFSEYALQDPRAYQYIRPILTANYGTAIFLSTPRGKNHLFELYEIARNNPETWFCYKLTIDDTNHIPFSEIEKERQEGIMSEDLIQQEYYTSFTMGVEGSYYAKYLDRMRVKNQIGSVPYEIGFKVHTAWDIGIRDSTTIIFFQTIGQTVRIIDCYENSKVGLEHYINVIKQKEYIYGKHIAPHDIRVREFTSGISRIDKARALGISFTIAPDLSVEDGIESVRSSLGKMWIDDIKCKPLIKALENYRQEWDIRHKVYKPHPLHDWSSHWADSMRYLCISLPKTKDGLSPEELDKRYNESRMGNESNIPHIFRDDI